MADPTEEGGSRHHHHRKRHRSGHSDSSSHHRKRRKLNPQLEEKKRQTAQVLSDLLVRKMQEDEDRKKEEKTQEEHRKVDVAKQGILDNAKISSEIGPALKVMKDYITSPAFNDLDTKQRQAALLLHQLLKGCKELEDSGKKLFGGAENFNLDEKSEKAFKEHCSQLRKVVKMCELSSPDILNNLPPNLAQVFQDNGQSLNKVLLNAIAKPVQRLKEYPSLFQKLHDSLKKSDPFNSLLERASHFVELATKQVKKSAEDIKSSISRAPSIGVASKERKVEAKAQKSTGFFDLPAKEQSVRHKKKGP